MTRGRGKTHGGHVGVEVSVVGVEELLHEAVQALVRQVPADHHVRLARLRRGKIGRSRNS